MDKQHKAMHSKGLARALKLRETRYMNDTPIPSALFLREQEVRRGIELLYFGQAHLWRHIDARLAQENLGRAHQRALYFIARKPGLNVTTLLRLLGITKQSLGRVLNELQKRDLVQSQSDPRDARQRQLFLTDSGRALEHSLFEALRAAMAEAYAAAGQQAVGGFWQVLLGLVRPEDRALLNRLPAVHNS